jgi:hypothetical protein
MTEILPSARVPGGTVPTVNRPTDASAPATCTGFAHLLGVELGAEASPAAAAPDSAATAASEPPPRPARAGPHKSLSGGRALNTHASAELDEVDVVARHSQAVESDDLVLVDEIEQAVAFDGGDENDDVDLVEQLDPLHAPGDADARQASHHVKQVNHDSHLDVGADLAGQYPTIAQDYPRPGNSDEAVATMSPEPSFAAPNDLTPRTMPANVAADVAPAPSPDISAPAAASLADANEAHPPQHLSAADLSPEPSFAAPNDLTPRTMPANVAPAPSPDISAPAAASLADANEAHPPQHLSAAELNSGPQPPTTAPDRALYERLSRPLEMPQAALAITASARSDTPGHIAPRARATPVEAATPAPTQMQAAATLHDGPDKEVAAPATHHSPPLATPQAARADGTPREPAAPAPTVPQLAVTLHDVAESRAASPISTASAVERDAAAPLPTDDTEALSTAPRGARDNSAAFAATVIEAAEDTKRPLAPAAPTADVIADSAPPHVPDKTDGEVHARTQGERQNAAAPGATVGEPVMPAHDLAVQAPAVAETQDRAARAPGDSRLSEAAQPELAGEARATALDTASAPAPQGMQGITAAAEAPSLPMAATEEPTGASALSLDISASAWHDHLRELLAQRLASTSASLAEGRTLVLQLQPRVMGAITLSLSLNASNAIELRMSASSERTRRFFTREAGFIAASFARGGLNISRIRVSDMLDPM